MDINSIKKFPFTDKKMLLEDQKKFPPFGSNLRVGQEKIRRIHKTSGTTNTPLYIAMTESDISQTVQVGKKCFELSGLTSGDTVIHCLNYNLWMGGYTDHQSLEATGASVIPFGVGNTHNLIETILFIKPTAIHCTPSYLAKIEMILEKDFGLKPADLGLKLGLFGGESGLQNPAFRKNIEQKWGIKAMNANYGMADVLSMFGAECFKQDGLHFMGEGVIFPELINPVDLETVIIEKGEEGELVLTNLTREAQPVTRYRTGDLIRILSTEKCECGCSGFKFELIGRSDDMIVVKGVNVFANAIENIVNTFPGDLSGIFQIHISKQNPIDKVLLKIELDKSAEILSKLDKEELKTRICWAFKTHLHFSPEIELVNWGVLPRTEGKSKKIFRTL